MTSPKSEVFLAVAGGLLSRGHRVRFRAEGDSMHPAIRGGEAIVVEPVSPEHLKKGDIVLYLSGRGITAHRVVKILAGGAAYSLEERELRSLEGNPSSVSAPQTQWSLRARRPSGPVASNGALAECSLSELLERSARFKSLASSAALLKRSAPQVKRSFFVLRGDAPGSADEPVEQEQILGKVVAVERAGRSIDLDNQKAKMLQTFGILIYRLKRTISNHIRTNGLMQKWNIGIMGS